jgi:hypothetical protein
MSHCFPFIKTQVWVSAKQLFYKFIIILLPLPIWPIDGGSRIC